MKGMRDLALWALSCPDHVIELVVSQWIEQPAPPAPI